MNSIGTSPPFDHVDNFIKWAEANDYTVIRKDSIWQVVVEMRHRSKWRGNINFINYSTLRWLVTPGNQCPRGFLPRTFEDYPDLYWNNSMGGMRPSRCGLCGMKSTSCMTCYKKRWVRRIVTSWLLVVPHLGLCDDISRQIAIMLARVISA